MILISIKIILIFYNSNNCNSKYINIIIYSYIDIGSYIIYKYIYVYVIEIEQ